MKILRDLFPWSNRVIRSKIGIAIVTAIAASIVTNTYNVHSKVKENKQLRASTASFFIVDINDMLQSMKKDFSLVIDTRNGSNYAKTSINRLRLTNYDANIKNLIYLNKDSKRAVMNLYSSFREYSFIRTDMLGFPNGNFNRKRESLEEVYKSILKNAPEVLKLLEEDSRIE